MICWQQIRPGEVPGTAGPTGAVLPWLRGADNTHCG
jgi:hypothetical protein